VKLIRCWGRVSFIRSLRGVVGRWILLGLGRWSCSVSLLLSCFRGVAGSWPSLLFSSTRSSQWKSGRNEGRLNSRPPSHSSLSASLPFFPNPPSTNTQADSLSLDVFIQKNQLSLPRNPLLLRLHPPRPLLPHPHPIATRSPKSSEDPSDTTCSEGGYGVGWAWYLVSSHPSLFCFPSRESSEVARTSGRTSLRADFTCTRLLLLAWLIGSSTTLNPSGRDGPHRMCRALENCSSFFRSSSPFISSPSSSSLNPTSPSSCHRLIDFFRFYCNVFAFNTDVVSIRAGLLTKVRRAFSAFRLDCERPLLSSVRLGCTGVETVDDG